MEKRKDDIVYTTKFSAGRRRTYFFDIRQTRQGDHYVTLTESKKNQYNDGYHRHKLFIYKEDLTRIIRGLEELLGEMKNIMPDYDFDEFARRADERRALYEQQLKEQQENPPTEEVEEPMAETKPEETTEPTDVSTHSNVSEEPPEPTIEEDDLSW